MYIFYLSQFGSVGCSVTCQKISRSNAPISSFGEMSRTQLFAMEQSKQPNFSNDNHKLPQNCAYFSCLPTVRLSLGASTRSWYENKDKATVEEQAEEEEVSVEEQAEEDVTVEVEEGLSISRKGPRLGGDCRLCMFVVIALPRSCYASQGVHFVYSAVDEGSGL